MISAAIDQDERRGMRLAMVLNFALEQMLGVTVSSKQSPCDVRLRPAFASINVSTTSIFFNIHSPED